MGTSTNTNRPYFATFNRFNMHRVGYIVDRSIDIIKMFIAEELTGIDDRKIINIFDDNKLCELAERCIVEFDSWVMRHLTENKLSRIDPEDLKIIRVYILYALRKEDEMIDVDVMFSDNAFKVMSITIKEYGEDVKVTFDMPMGQKKD